MGFLSISERVYNHPTKNGIPFPFRDVWKTSIVFKGVTRQEIAKKILASELPELVLSGLSKAKKPLKAADYCVVYINGMPPKNEKASDWTKVITITPRQVEDYLRHYGF